MTSDELARLLECANEEEARELAELEAQYPPTPAPDHDERTPRFWSNVPLNARDAVQHKWERTRQDLIRQYDNSVPRNG